MIHLITYSPEFCFEKILFCFKTKCKAAQMFWKRAHLCSLRVLSRNKNSAKCEKGFCFFTRMAYAATFVSKKKICKWSFSHVFRLRLELREFGMVVLPSSSEIFQKTFSWSNQCLNYPVINQVYLLKRNTICLSYVVKTAFKWLQELLNVPIILLFNS